MLAGLPPVAATDVKLDSGAIQLWVALEGYGMYQAMAPHRAGDPRLITSAGLIARAAAPGTLFSVEGARVNSANAGGLPVPVLVATDTGSQIQIPFEARGDSLALAIDGPGGARMLPSGAAGFDRARHSTGSDAMARRCCSTPITACCSMPCTRRIRMRASRSWPPASARCSRPGPPVCRLRPILRIPWPLLSARCSIALPVQVTRAILYPNYVGMYLVEIEIPNIVNYGPAELYIEVDGQPSNRVRVYIEP